MPSAASAGLSASQIARPTMIASAPARRGAAGLPPWTPTPGVRMRRSPTIARRAFTRSGRCVHARADAVLSRKALADDPSCARRDRLLDDEAVRVRNVRDLEVAQDVPVAGEIADDPGARRQDEGPADLHGVHMATGRLRDRGREAGVRDVEGEDEPTRDPHRPPNGLPMKKVLAGRHWVRYD